MEIAKDDSEKCTHVGQFGQCKYVVVPGTFTCEHHGGNATAQTNATLAANSYKLQIFQARLDQHTGHAGLKNIRGEIGLLRMLIESKLNACKDDYDLMLQSASLGDLIMKVATVVTACHRLETSSGELMDKQTLAQFAEELVKCVSEVVDDEQLDTIAEKILCLMKTL